MEALIFICGFISGALFVFLIVVRAQRERINAYRNIEGELNRLRSLVRLQVK